MRVEKADKPHGSVRYCGMYVCIYIYIYTIGDIAAYVRARAVKKSWERPCRLWKKGIRTDFFFFCRKKKKKLGNSGERDVRIFHAFFRRLIVPIFYGRKKEKMNVSKPCCPHRVNSRYSTI